MIAQLAPNSAPMQCATLKSALSACTCFADSVVCGSGEYASSTGANEIRDDAASSADACPFCAGSACLHKLARKASSGAPSPRAPHACVSAWYAFSVACAVSSVPHRASSSESEPSKGCHSAFAIPRAARSSAGAFGGEAAPPSASAAASSAASASEAMAWARRSWHSIARAAM